ncbi:hypothetical protein [Aeromicrobium alkaliterrae]|uniref:Bacterial Ig-like domain-containing protein n=1 Tax=Aeromicrobium alkaliterrae TaxID=302168 RepID=A0ABN2JYB2_9ACTN
MSKRLSRLVAVASIALVGSVLAVGAPAQADTSDPNRLGDLILDKTSGTSLTVESQQWTTVDTAAGAICPTGFRQRSGLTATNASGVVQQVGARARATDTLAAGATLGLSPSDAKIHRTADYAWSQAWQLTVADATQLPAGVWEIKHTCQATDTYVPATDKYYSVWIQINADRSWAKIANVGPVAPAKTTPTVAFSGSTANADGSVTLTATVKKADGSTATDATGQVAFQGTAAGATTVSQNVTPTNGVATWTTGVLSAGKQYTFTAGFVGGSDALYNDSTANASTTVTTVAQPVAPQTGDTDITVTIPASPGGLTLTTTPGTVALSTPLLEGTDWVATGNLGEVTVADYRANRVGWNLNGKVTNFVQTADSTKTIAKSNLGWTPQLVGDASANAGAAGNPVLAGTGLTDAGSTLASAAPGVAGTETKVKAGLTLKAPSSSTAAGAYKATLTLTLI